MNNCEEIKFKTAGSYVYYVKAGTGARALVVVTGVSLVGFEGFGPAIAKQYRPMLDDYTLYYFDRRRDIDQPVTIADLTEDIYNALVDAGVIHAHFIGFSQGGMISLTMALNHPEMVEGLIICSGTAYTDAKTAECGKRWRRWLEQGDIYHFNLEFYQSIYSPEYYQKFEKAFERLANNGTPQQAGRFMYLIDAAKDFDLRPQLKNIKCPCFVIGSDNDSVMGSQPTIEMAAALGCSHYICENASHAVCDEDKGFVQSLYDILKDQ